MIALKLTSYRRYHNSRNQILNAQTARLYLSPLLNNNGRDHPPPLTLAEVDPDQLAGWLVEQGIGALAYRRYRQRPDPPSALVERLQATTFDIAAHNSLHFEVLGKILAAFRSAAIPVVILKGAVLAEAAYGSFDARGMADVDLWLQTDDVRPAVEILTGLGFRQGADKTERPLILQALSLGEIQFYLPGWEKGMVELHWSGFSGWWLRRTAAIDDAAIWQRSRPVDERSPGLQPGTDGLVRRLAAEDMVIQVAVHQAVNSQFSIQPVRGLLDVALAAQAWPVDWELVADRAAAWRVATAVWAVLHLTHELVGLPDAAPALKRLQPSPLRRRLLQRFIAPESIVAGKDWRPSRLRYLLLLLLIDRPRDILRLLYRTLWPETDWLLARYNETTGRGRHLWNVLRHGQV